MVGIIVDFDWDRSIWSLWTSQCPFVLNWN